MSMGKPKWDSKKTFAGYSNTASTRAEHSQSHHRANLQTPASGSRMRLEAFRRFLKNAIIPLTPRTRFRSYYMNILRWIANWASYHRFLIACVQEILLQRKRLSKNACTYVSHHLCSHVPQSVGNIWKGTGWYLIWREGRDHVSEFMPCAGDRAPPESGGN